MARNRNLPTANRATMPTSPNSDQDSQAGTSGRTKRTRSGRSRPINDPDFVDSDGAEVSEEDDREDDFDEEIERPRKRTKTTTSRAAPGGGKGKSKGKGRARKTLTLSLFPTMPMDILYEIMSRLTPGDLISLSRVSKAFRDLLMSRKSKVLWKTLLDAEDCPECPTSWSEPAYAVLLFGEPVCELCGAKKIHHVNFGLGRRICGRCLKSRLVSTKQFNSYCSSVDYYILDLLPYSYKNGQRFYLKQDIHAMSDRFKNLKATESAATVSSFIVSCAARCIEMQTLVRDLEDWVISREAQKRVDRASRVQQRWEEIQRRLRLLGHVQEDIDKLKHESIVKRDALVTDASWARNRKQLDSLATEKKRTRIVASRSVALDAAYTKFKLGVLPMRRRMLPRLFELKTLPSVEAILNQDLNTSVDTETFASLDFDELGSEWLELSKEQLLQAVQNGFSDGLAPSAEEAKKLATFPLTSAALVFRCATTPCRVCSTEHGDRRRGEPFISVDSALYHHCYSYGPNTPTTFSLSPIGCQIALQILALLDLDPAVTTADDLDRLDPLFICNLCNNPGRSERNNLCYSTRNALSWRECIFHASLSKHYQTPKFRCLSLKEQQHVEERPNDCSIWLCNHCYHADGRRFLHEDVVEHLKSNHSVDNPAEKMDYFCDPNMSYIPPARREIWTPVDDSSR